MPYHQTRTSIEIYKSENDQAVDQHGLDHPSQAVDQPRLDLLVDQPRLNLNPRLSVNKPSLPEVHQKVSLAKLVVVLMTIVESLQNPLNFLSLAITTKAIAMGILPSRSLRLGYKRC